MEITRDKKTFKPFTINVKIETEEEMTTLSNMCNLNVSIPDIVFANYPNGCNVHTVEKFLEGFKRSLKEN